MNKLVPVVALMLVSGLVYAVDPPEVKEGLWSIHKQMINKPGNKKTERTYTICRNHAYDQHALSLAKPMQGCTTISKAESGKYFSESHCTVAGTVIDSKGTATYQGDTSAHSETHATYTPAMAGLSEMTTIMDQKYVGSCPSGIQPGDMTIEGGRVTHLWKH